jgi:hypothetical protein
VPRHIIARRSGTGQYELPRTPPYVDFVSNGVPNIRRELPFVDQPGRAAGKNNGGIRLRQRGDLRRSIERDTALGGVQGGGRLARSAGALKDHRAEDAQVFFYHRINDSRRVFIHGHSITQNPRFHNCAHFFLSFAPKFFYHLRSFFFIICARFFYHLRGGGRRRVNARHYTGEHLILHKREPVILVSAVRPQMRSESSIAHKYNSLFFIFSVSEYFRIDKQRDVT